MGMVLRKYTFLIQIHQCLQSYVPSAAAPSEDLMLKCVLIQATSGCAFRLLLTNSEIFTTMKTAFIRQMLHI